MMRILLALFCLVLLLETSQAKIARDKVETSVASGIRPGSPVLKRRLLARVAKAMNTKNMVYEAITRIPADTVSQAAIGEYIEMKRNTKVKPNELTAVLTNCVSEGMLIKEGGRYQFSDRYFYS